MFIGLRFYTVLIFIALGSERSVILSNTTFESLKEYVNEATLRGIQDMGFTHMTHIQAKTIPPLLEGMHLVAFILVICIVL